MARYEFDPVDVTFTDAENRTQRLRIAPPPLDLPWTVRLVLRIIRPVINRVLRWAERSVDQALVQIGAGTDVRQIVRNLFAQLRRALKNTI